MSPVETLNLGSQQPATTGSLARISQRSSSLNPWSHGGPRRDRPRGVQRDHSAGYRPCRTLG